MNTEAILKLTGDDLSKAAGKVFVSHECPICEGYREHYTQYGNLTKCTLCAHRYFLPLTWPEAMKRRDWAVEKFGWKKFIEAYRLVFESNPKEIRSKYMIATSKPTDYIKAAMICASEGE